MKILIFVALFIIGGVFINAAHIPAWLLGGQKPTHRYWKLYGFIGACIWALVLFLANTAL